MKKPAILMAAMFSTVIVAGAALAQEPTLPRSPKVFAKLDSDSDGKITLAEIKPKAEKRFQRLDRDRNGEVSAAEIDAALQRVMERRRNRILKAMDTDGNGAISTAELDAFVGLLMKSADTDGDGAVTLDEARNFRVAKLRKPATGDGAN